MPVDPIKLLQIPLVLALSTLFALAALYDLRAKKKRKKHRDPLYRCKDCRLVYTAEHQTPTARCPRCGKQNLAARH